MNKKNLLFLLALVAIAIAFIAVSVPSCSSEKTHKDSKTLVSKRIKEVKRKPSVRKDRPAKKTAFRVRTEEVREKPNILAEMDDEKALSAEMRKLLEDIQTALDKEDRKGLSKLVDRILAAQRQHGPDAVPVSIRKKAVEAIGWFLPDSLAELVGFMSDTDPDVIDDVMTQFQSAIDNPEMSDRELSAILKSMSQILSNEEALDALFMGVESDMRNSVALDTYKFIIQNGSDAAKARVWESIQDFTCEDGINAVDQLDAWYKENPDDDYDEDFYGGDKN